MPSARGPRRIGGGRWWLLAAGSLVVLAAAYLAAVHTYTGQRVENAALRGSFQVNIDETTAADQALASLTLASLALAVLILAIIGWVRGGPRLAAVAVGIVAGGALVTEVLKESVLTRPPLVEAPVYWLDNSFPSGHTTVAMCVAAATLIVVPWRWRTLAMLIVTLWTVGVGAYTVVARWHRLSDTLGANAVGVLVASLGALLLLRSGLVRRVSDERGAPLRALLLAVAVLYALGAGVIGVFVGLTGLQQDPGTTADFNLYLAAQSLASVGSVVAILLVWWSWQRLETA